MRKLVSRFSTAVVVAALAYGGGALLSAEKQAVRQDKEREVVRVYEVFGLGCAACEGGLTKLLEKVKGVKKADANWKDQLVSVTFADKQSADDEMVFEAIRKANLTPGERIEGERKEGEG